jgi:hypothetical protein
MAENRLSPGREFVTTVPVFLGHPGDEQTANHKLSLHAELAALGSVHELALITAALAQHCSHALNGQDASSSRVTVSYSVLLALPKLRLLRTAGSAGAEILGFCFAHTC